MRRVGSADPTPGEKNGEGEEEATVTTTTITATIAASSKNAPHPGVGRDRGEELRRAAAEWLAGGSEQRAGPRALTDHDRFLVVLEPLRELFH